MTSFRKAWKTGLVLLVLLVLILSSRLTSRYWTVLIARSLVCAEDVEPSDAMLIENFNPDYILFEQAAALEKAGRSAIALVPVEAFQDRNTPNPISTGIAEVMARQAHLRVWRTIPVAQIEPISLNAAVQILKRLRSERITSVIIITPGLRSRRSLLIYRTIFGGAGIAVYCVPVFRWQTTPERWTQTWHGIQEVTEEFLKLQYYRFYVLPFMVRGVEGG